MDAGGSDDESCEALAHDCHIERSTGDYVFDLARLAFVRYIGADLTKVTVAADGIHLKGGGCDQTVPL